MYTSFGRRAAAEFSRGVSTLSLVKTCQLTGSHQMVSSVRFQFEVTANQRALHKRLQILPATPERDPARQTVTFPIQMATQTTYPQNHLAPGFEWLFHPVF